LKKEIIGMDKADKALVLSNTEMSALKILKEKITRQFEIVDVILYGSAACRKTDIESDIDLLIITSEPLSRERRHEITDIVFEVNLEYNTNFSTLVVDKDSWETGYFSVLPIKEEILKEGLPV
jgi:predicted nucleotidyltransferase